MNETLILLGAVVAAIVAVLLIFARLYRRSSKEVSYVRTGLGGQKVIMNGGALVMPVVHEVIPVNMNTLRLEVRRADEAALITRDRMRVDVVAEFYVRAQPTAESIANAAQTLGRRTMEPESLKDLIEGKFVDALRSVAAEMAMEELHERRIDFVQRVQNAVSEDLLKNGLELETVSLTGLDQTRRDYFNPDNAFDAEGLTKLTQEIEERRKKRNDIEQDTQVAIARKNLEAEQMQLEITRDQEYFRLEQQREIAVRRAGQEALISTEKAQREREAREAQIHSEQEVRRREIAQKQALEAAEIERRKTIELTEQDREIAIADRSRARSEAQAEADAARAIAVRASEQVETVREIEAAERRKQVDLVEARQAAERQAISVRVGAEAEREAAEDQAEAQRQIARGEADRARILAEAEADAVRQKAEADEVRFRVEAEGARAINEAANMLSAEQIAMQVRLRLIEELPKIIAESVRPMERIEQIKILQVDGLMGAAGGGGNGVNGNGDDAGSMSDRLVNSALRYRGQAPLVDALLKELDLDGGLGNLGRSAGKMAGRDTDGASPAGKNGADGRGIDTGETAKG
ncbi:flotillin family protein [Jiella pelagia]|uniref:SPFH domain-containing protein n=1 Tax=Jiella pelagia TaxID=2986949 RepID=A0ABY7BUV7_9HYPH|nr:flotillin domain-containing protein [Jiella pelagia]WAP67576.1 SPFH domain-containing protein [Jiella pelagia]